MDRCAAAKKKAFGTVDGEEQCPGPWHLDPEGSESGPSAVQIRKIRVPARSPVVALPPLTTTDRPQRLQLVQGQSARRECWFGNGVVDPSALAPDQHQTGLSKDPEMVRHQRLPDVHALRELGDRALPRDEVLEDSKTRLVAEGAEAQRGDGARMVGAAGHVVLYQLILV